MTPRTRRRLTLAAFLAAVVALGVASRTFRVGWWPIDKSLGDVLYAAAAYLAVGIAFPRARSWLVAVAALAACAVVECLQLTGANAALLRVPVLRWFLGTTFSWHDLACYAVGAAVAAGIDARHQRH